MADVFVTNTSNGSTINGTPADRLVVTHTVDGGVSGSVTGSLAAGYSGTFTTGAGTDIITLRVEATKNVEGGSGMDRLVLTFTDNGGVTSSFVSNAGTFDGPGNDNVFFSGTESSDFLFS